MEELVDAHVDNPRRSGRERKAIERFAPSAPDDMALSIHAPAAMPVSKAAGASRQVKRRSSDEPFQNAAKRRKTSTSVAMITAEGAAGSTAESVDDENIPVTSNATTYSDMISAQPDTNGQGATSSRGNASPRTSATTARVQAKAQSIPSPDARPEPCGAPLVHAETRQALCETLPYYRSYQSSSYTADGLVYSALLSHDASGMGYVDSEVVIMRSSGHCGRDESGRMVQVTDQKEDEANVRSFRQSKEEQVALIVIASKQNLDIPVKLPHEFCVLDYFQITDIWSAQSNGKKCFMYRLEKMYRDTKSWWDAKDSPDCPHPPTFPQPAARMTCSTCNEESPQVYTEGWLCLNGGCAKFWMFGRKQAPENLTYNKEFLAERTQWPTYIEPPMSIIPDLPQPTSEDEATFAFSRFGWKGIVCPLCGRCNARRRWEEWRCETKDCSFVYEVKQPILTHRAVMDGHAVAFTGHAPPKNNIEPPVIKKQTEFLGGWRMNTYEMLPGNKVVHFQANERVNAVPGGAHDLFRAVQKDGVGLQRFPMHVKMGSGEFLASHFSVNYGMPYEYVVDVEQNAFRDAPPAILTALHRCEWAATQSLGLGTFQPFNELLAVGYFEDGKMGFHDDGEESLGPVIATLSLGGSAKMTFKMKDRYYKGLTKTGKYNPNEFVPPGAALEEERKELNELYGNIPDEDFNQLRLKMYAENKDKLRKASPVLVTVKLLHGDIIIMNGGEMQKYYVHKVESTGKVRFGLTCRHVKKELVDASQHWKGEHGPQTEKVNYEGTCGIS